MVMYYLAKSQSDFDGVLLVDQSRCEGIFTEPVFSNKALRYHIEYIFYRGEKCVQNKGTIFNPALDRFSPQHRVV